MASAKYRSIIAKYRDHLAARKRMDVILRKLDQCRVAVGVLEDAVKGDVDDVRIDLQEASEDIEKFTVDLSVEPLHDLAGLIAWFLPRFSTKCLWTTYLKLHHPRWILTNMG